MASAQATTPGTSSQPLDHEIIIVGAGFAGIGAAIELKKFGIEDFILLEKADDVGGVWRDNTYPGLTVDVPILTYSYSFEQYPDFTNLYAPGQELKAYANHCTEKYGVRPHIRFGKTIDHAEYDEDRNVWRSHLSDGSILVSRYLVSASGLLIKPKMPDIKGIESFQGTIMHSARWNHDVDLVGKRIAVIGTGASGIQLIPILGEQAESLDVYQRTPIWIMPKPDLSISPRMRSAFRSVPGFQRLARILLILMFDALLGIAMLRHGRFPWVFRWAEKKLTESIRKQVDDPEIQEKLIPSYGFFCKRPSFSNVYFPTFNRANVELVTDPIDHIDESAIVDESGSSREIDVLICATGYSIFDRDCPPTFEVFGKNGKNLGDHWSRNRFKAFHGATVPDFPNFFLMLGPYGAAGGSYFDLINTASHHLARCLRAAAKRNANYFEIKQSAHDEDFEKVLRKRRNMVMFTSNCTSANSYYFDRHGDVPAIRPSSYLAHWLWSRTFSMRSYRFDKEG